MFKQVEDTDEAVSGTWISDRPASEEHPVVPLGINEMTVPRISILASFGTIVMLIISGFWLGFAACCFRCVPQPAATMGVFELLSHWK